MPGGVHPPRGARGECDADEREPLIPTPASPPLPGPLQLRGRQRQPKLEAAASRIRREPVSRGDTTRTLQVLVVPRD